MRSFFLLACISSIVWLAGCGSSPPVNTVSKAELSCANAKQRLSQLVPAVNKAERTKDVQLMKTTLTTAAVIIQDARREIAALSNPPGRLADRLPQLKLNVLYPVQYPGKNLSLASGSILTAHADFVNGWQPAEQQALINDCLTANVSCGRLRDRTQQQAWKPSPPIAAEQIRSLLQAGV